MGAGVGHPPKFGTTNQVTMTQSIRLQEHDLIWMCQKLQNLLINGKKSVVVVVVGGGGGAPLKDYVYYYYSMPSSTSSVHYFTPFSMADMQNL